MDQNTLLLVGALAAAAWAAVSAHHARVSSLPEVATLSKNAGETRAEVAALRAEWTSYLKALDAALEALEEQSSVVQRHRNRVEQANRRADRREQPELDPMSAALARARAQGLDV